MIAFTVSSVGIDTTAFFKSHVNKAHKAGLRAAAEYWQEKQLPWHFKPGAAERYKYQPRSRGNRALHVRLKTPPLVVSGDLRAAVIGGDAKITTTNRRVTLKIDGLPSYVRNKRSDADEPAKVRIRSAIAKAQDAVALAVLRGRSVVPLLAKIGKLRSQLDSVERSSRQPIIRAELVTTTEIELNRLRTPYTRAVNQYLSTNPDAKKKSRR